MKIRIHLVALFLSMVLFYGCESISDKPTNVVLILIDDLSHYGVSAYGSNAVSSTRGDLSNAPMGTPQIDKLAEQGVLFDNAYISPLCETSRISLMSGKVNARNYLRCKSQHASDITFGDVFSKAGYTTGVIGKWHLGLGDGTLNWNDSIKPGPREIGFDYSFLIPATGDRVPSAYVENYNIVGLDTNDPVQVSYKTKVGDWPTGTESPELLKQQADPQHSGTITNGVSRIGFMIGGETALWKDEDFPFVLNEKAKAFIYDSKDEPFFMYYAYHDIHVPRIPNEKFVGASTMGPRGDAIAQMDWCTGEIVKYLEELGLDKNTLIIFSSDNGPVLDDGYSDQSVELLGEHKPAGIFRGGKYSAFEAGTRVPTIVYWPGKVAQAESNALLSQVDLYASLAELINQPLAQGDAPDSKSTIDAWLGKTQLGKASMLEESYTKSLRVGDWKYIEPSNANSVWIENDKNIESGITTIPQLYNLSNDPSELNNIAEDNQEQVMEMENALKEMLR